MQYIILDMEWNQAWPGSSAARQPLPSPIRGEIVQIGAVRVREDQQLAGEFQILIRPKYFKKMNSKISKLTGIKDARLRAEGVPFPEAMARFRAWCGEDCVFLTWGFDDIAVLKDNLALYAMQSDWVSRWYNAQLIFNVQTDGAMPRSSARGWTSRAAWKTMSGRSSRTRTASPASSFPAVSTAMCSAAMPTRPPHWAQWRGARTAAPSVAGR